MLRLDPAHPPLWRDADTLQFGLDDRARLDDPQPWELALLAELADGVTPATLSALATERSVSAAQLDALLAEIQPVLVREASAVRVVVLAGRGVPAATVELVAGALERGGAATRTPLWPDAVDLPAIARDETVVVLASHLVEPRAVSALMAGDIPHVPIAFDAGGAVVGPVVRPGETACLACAAAWARESDAAWPVLASQLVGRPCSVDPDVATAAARTAVQLITGPDGAAGRSVTLRADDPHRRWRRHAPHEECACRSLGGTVTEISASGRSPAPSSARGFARPA